MRADRSLKRQDAYIRPDLSTRRWATGTLKPSQYSGTRSPCSLMGMLGIFIVLTALLTVVLLFTSASDHHISLSNIPYFSRSYQDQEQLIKFSTFQGTADTLQPSLDEPIAHLKPLEVISIKELSSAITNKIGLQSPEPNKNINSNIIKIQPQIVDNERNNKKIESNIVRNDSPDKNLKSGVVSSTSQTETGSADLAALFKDESQKRLSLVTERLKAHPIFSIYHPNDRLEEVMHRLSQSEACKNKPIFTGMASVSSDIYWQLIENFVYSMLKFDLVECSILICVSDEDCMAKCKLSSFPCYNYDYFHYHPDKKSSSISPMEQIATLKLFELPKALAKGVSIFIVDLDVGFLDDPMRLVKNFMKPENIIDIYVQKDISFVMDRSLKGWRTWFTVPLPNIGIFLCKGNEKTTAMFDIAWKDYLTIDKPIKMNPGKDQNKVVNALHVATSVHGLKWRYFDNNETVLLDKVFKFVTEEYELGGTAADSNLRRFGTIAAHTTCYDSKTKVMGLKASNAFWNPFYYDYSRRTITKKLIYATESELLHEVRSLVYLALVTDRTLIIPNILGFSSLDNIRYRDKTFWPSFRVLYSTDDLISNSIVETQFYWRMSRDYSAAVSPQVNSDKMAIPPAKIVDFNSSHATIGDIEALLKSDQFSSAIRIVLNGDKDPIASQRTDREVAVKRLLAWADDPLEGYDGYHIESKNYLFLPRIDGIRVRLSRSIVNKRIANRIATTTRLCRRIFSPNQGNRSCFDKCR